MPVQMNTVFTSAKNASFSKSEFADNVTDIDIILAACVSLFILLCVYLVIALLVFEIRSRKTSRSSRRLSRRISNISSQVIDNRKLKLRILCIIATVAVLLRCVAELFYIFMGRRSDYRCDVSLKLHICLFAVSITTIYVFLWYRQRLMYMDPQMQLHNTALGRWVSRYVLVLMVVSAIGIIVIFLTLRKYSAQENTCIAISVNFGTEVPFLIIACCLVLFQVLLMVLFIRPLFCNAVIPPDLNRNGDNLTRRVLKRVTITAAICVGSDIAAAIVTLISEQILVSNVVYDASLVLNLICIVCSFSDWKARMFPMLERPNTSLYSFDSVANSTPNRPSHLPVKINHPQSNICGNL
ncbi:uncharacterized protein LOC144743106 isoform X1 [Ciona intestinalis]